MVAVLALQGAFIEHRQMLEKLGVETCELRKKAHLEQEFSGLILPGGESTVQGKLLHDLDMFDLIQEKIQQGLPVYGTCAGMILLAKELENSKSTHLATMDMTVVRNAYGRQLGSFETKANFAGTQIPMSFIRAPYIKELGSQGEVLAEVDGKIVAARQGNQLVTAFHPEVTDDTKVHEYFLTMLR